MKNFEAKGVEGKIEEYEPKVEMVSIDGDTVHLFFPRWNKYVTFVLQFPSLAAQDKFLESPRGKEDLKKFGGKIFTVNPHDVSSEASGEPAETDNKSPDEMESRTVSMLDLADELGVSYFDLCHAFDFAKAVFIEMYGGKIPRHAVYEYKLDKKNNEE